MKFFHDYEFDEKLIDEYFKTKIVITHNTFAQFGNNCAKTKMINLQETVI